MELQPTVMLVEDDAEMRNSLQWLLESRQLNVDAYACPRAFLAAYDPDKPGCIVLALQLPELGGLEVYDCVRQRGGRHPLIVISAFGCVSVAVDVMRSGAIDFIEKPFSHERFLARVEQAIQADASMRRFRESVWETHRRLGALSQREWEVAELVASGKASKQIAAALGIAPKTVEVHRRNIMIKLKAASSAEMAAVVARAKMFGDAGFWQLAAPVARGVTPCNPEPFWSCGVGPMAN